MKVFGISLGIYDLFVLSLTLLVIKILSYYYKYYTRKDPLPAPFPLPFVGHIFDHLIYSSDFSEYCHQLQDKYGDIYEQWFGSERVIFTTRIEDMDKILSPSTKSKYLTRLPNPEGLKELGVFGKGLLLNHDVSNWKFNRQFFTQAVSTLNFLKESVNCTQAVFNEMEEYWKIGLDDNIITDFSEWSHGLATDIIFQMITGKKTWATASYLLTVSPGLNPINLQGLDKEDIKKSSELSKAFQTYIMGLDFFTFFPKWVRLYIPGFRDTHKKILSARDVLFNKLDDIIKERRKEIEGTPKNEKLRSDMLTLLITANTDRNISDTKDNTQEYTKPLTDEEIRGIIIEALGGGIDTTANVFSFIIYYLAHYPDVKNRLRQEIDNTISHRSITYEDLSRLTYCEAVIKEVTRMMATAPFIGRVSSEPDLIGGVVREAGTRYFIFTPGIHLNKDFWEEPQKFNVDRFVNFNEQEQQSEKKYSLIMWGGGLRQCPGRKMAMIELKSLLVLAFKNWDIDLVDLNAPLKYEVGLVRSAKDLNVTIKPRSN
ncbi:18339_t:CDS:2 [Acaulospora morrowiae]|uniref:18339_t:CDS:1 n=1 Tax=Acaulospora morrowiae TaxID=94023 RepID=A0A9N8WHC5_9GLOM|nr:18339_t:CDS:2 [Acaulospora morrowiae]